MGRVLSTVILALLLPVAGTAATSERPAHWAVPIPSGHLKNFYQLDEKVFRSDQPDRRGFEELQQRGVRNVLSFRDHHSDERKAKGLGLKLHRVEMDAGDLRTEDIIQALRIIREADGPVLIHCWHGSDRTGAVSAMYRIVFQSWSKEEAINELRNGGYGYHSLYTNIPAFIQNANIDLIKRKVFSP